MSESTIIIPSVTNNGSDASVFSSRAVALHGDNARRLSEQLAAVNFRLRESHSSYRSDWHVAGDPTLLVILRGVIRITLRNEESRVFSPGDMFIAEDYLAEGIVFDDRLHGHCAEVVTDQMIDADVLKVIHIKLAKR